MDDTRTRLITTTLELFRRHGYSGTSLSQVTKTANVPTGSLYHHFRGGKDELTIAVIDTAGTIYRQLLEAIWDAEANPAASITAFFNGAADVLEQTDFIDPCPVGSVAREVASSNPAIREAAHRAFDSWSESVKVRLLSAGMDEAAATEYATTLVAAIEGGFIVSRSARDANLLRATGSRLARSLQATLDRLAPDSPPLKDLRSDYQH